MPKEIAYVIGVNDFDKTLLPTDARTPGTDAFQKAVSDFYTKEYVAFGGSVRIVVDAKTISVSWTPDNQASDPIQIAVDAVKSGDYRKGTLLLELIRQQEPNRVDVLYNLGMALSDLGQIDLALRHLEHALSISPEHVNTLVAVGVALTRQQKHGEAIPILQKAVTLDSRNPWAHRNLGACLLHTGQNVEGENELRLAVDLAPNDQQAVFGLAEALFKNGKEEEADKFYTQVIQMDDRTSIADLAKEARSRISQLSFRSGATGGVQPDAVMYLLGALQQFGKMSREQVQQIALEIAILGQRGLNPNISDERYHLRSLPGSFSALHLLCLMFVGFKIIAPQHSIGFDLEKEYNAAQAMYNPERGKGE